MHTKESQTEIFKNEGFAHVYEWTDASGFEYPRHAHLGRVAYYVLSGGMKITFNDGVKNLVAGDRFDVPVGVLHEALIGQDGCTYLVAEERKGTH